MSARRRSVGGGRGAVEEGDEGGGAGPQCFPLLPKGFPLLPEGFPLLPEGCPLFAERLHGFGVALVGGALCFGMALVGGALCFGMALVGGALCFGMALVGGVFPCGEGAVLCIEGAVASIGGPAHGPEADEDEDGMDGADEEGGGDVRGGDVFERGHGCSPGGVRGPARPPLRFVPPGR